VAGLWTDSPILEDEAGDPQLSFTMLTVNGAGHPVFERMHAPEDEKRMVVILEPADYSRWLDSPKGDAQEFFRQYSGDLRTYPAPRPPPKPRGPRLTNKAPVN
jgi:putative SOS response-associated peptidase YedK